MSSAPTMRRREEAKVVHVQDTHRGDGTTFEVLDDGMVSYAMPDGKGGRLVHHDFHDQPAQTCFVPYSNNRRPERGGHIAWAQHGVLHRANDRPAIIYADGSMEWWLNGKLIATAAPPAPVPVPVQNAPSDKEELEAILKSLEEETT